MKEEKKLRERAEQMKDTLKQATPVQLKKGEKFLAALRQVGNVSTAAQLAGIRRALPYEWAKQSEVFKEVFDAARSLGHEVLADSLERTLTERATEGVIENVYFKGQKIGEQRRYSDVGAIVMLKSLRPHRFVEQLMAVNVSGQQISIKIASFAAVPLPLPTEADSAHIEHNEGQDQ